MILLYNMLVSEKSGSNDGKKEIVSLQEQEGEVPLSEIGRLMQQVGVGIASKIYRDYEPNFPKARRNRTVEWIDLRNLIVLTSTKGLIDFREGFRFLTVYLGPKSASQDINSLKSLPSVGFFYSQEEKSGLWQCDMISVETGGESKRNIIIPIENGKAQQRTEGGSQFKSQRTKMEYLERQLGGYVDIP